MSKKKKRLDKKLIEERLRELEMETKQVKPKIEPKSAVAQVEKKEEAAPIAIIEDRLNPSDQMILKDMKKVMLVALVIVIIFVALFLINLKTDYILKVSDKLLNLLHVGQL